MQFHHCSFISHCKCMQCNAWMVHVARHAGSHKLKLMKPDWRDSWKMLKDLKSSPAECGHQCIIARIDHAVVNVGNSRQASAPGLSDQ